MFNSLRSTRPSASSQLDRSDHMVLTLLSGQQSIQVPHDGFTIGTGRRCDLKLSDLGIPPVHSRIYQQRGAIWIEAAEDEIQLLVNGKYCRRMALRDGDRISIGSNEFVIRLQAELARDLENSTPAETAAGNQDLSTLTAEELCDRIVSERQLAKELSEPGQSGWEALLQAINAVKQSPLSIDAEVDPLSSDQSTYASLLEQIQQLQSTIEEHAREASKNEANLLASTSLMEESQLRAVERLDRIVDQVSCGDSTGELRVSA